MINKLITQITIIIIWGIWIELVAFIFSRFLKQEKSTLNEKLAGVVVAYGVFSLLRNLI